MRRVTPAGFVLGMLASAGLVCFGYLLRVIAAEVAAAMLVAATACLVLLVGLAAWLGGRQVSVGAMIEWLRQPIFGRRPPGGVPTCRGCGYDLRASPYRCPECGRRVPSEDRFVIQYLMRLMRP